MCRPRGGVRAPAATPERCVWQGDMQRLFNAPGDAGLVLGNTSRTQPDHARPRRRCLPHIVSTPMDHGVRIAGSGNADDGLVGLHLGQFTGGVTAQLKADGRPASPLGRGNQVLPGELPATSSNHRIVSYDDRRLRGQAFRVLARSWRD